MASMLLNLAPCLQTIWVSIKRALDLGGEEGGNEVQPQKGIPVDWHVHGLCCWVPGSYR